MDAINLNKLNIGSQSAIKNSGHGGLIAALGLIFIASFGALVWWNLSGIEQDSHNELYLLPWVTFASVVIAAPSVFLWWRKKFDFFHPLVLAAWSYFFPAFALGGFILAFGISHPPFMYLISNPEYDLPLTFVYIALGFGGLSVGFILPWARQIGEWFSMRFIPRWDWKDSDIVFPSLVLLTVGLFFFFSSWFAGSLGYQKIELTDSFSSSNYFLSTIMLEATFVLWFFIFRSRMLNVFHIAIIILLGLTVLLRTILAGSKSVLLYSVILVVMAYVYSGRRLKLKQGSVFAALGVVALLVGVVYGITFRRLKGSEDKVSLTQYVDMAEETFLIMSTQDPTQTLTDGLSGLAERLETASSLAVVVSNYERLAPYEAAYGLENNIWTYTWTAFIPRALWSDKPIISDARGYSDLYFNFGNNSFAMTPMGDLLRNFGPVGVPLGMILMGFILRVIYTALIEDQQITIGRAAAYYMLITSFNYEGFYGTILPSLIRMAFVALVSLFFVNLLARSQSRKA